MDPAPLVVSGIAALIALVSLGVSFWLLHREPTDQSITTLAQELKRARKAEAMRSVREAAAEVRAASAPVGKDGQPLPFGPVEANDRSPVNIKQSLRRKVYGAALTHRGNGNEPA